MSQPPPLRPFSKKGFALAMCLLVVAAIALLGTAWLALDALLPAIQEAGGVLAATSNSAKTS